MQEGTKRKLKTTALSKQRYKQVINAWNNRLCSCCGKSINRSDIAKQFGISKSMVTSILQGDIGEGRKNRC